MVSENPFNEPTLPNEQKTSSDFVGNKNFKSPARNFMKMAQVDSLTQQDISENERIINSNTNSNDGDDGEVVNSDIELTLEESDDKEGISETEGAENSQKKKNELKNNVVKDTESLESLDNDLSNTAHLVGTGFSADEFDQIDCLDAIDGSTNDANSSNISKSTELDDRGKYCKNTPINGDVKCVDETHTKEVNSTNGESISNSSGNQQQIDTSPVKVERNNNKTEKIDENEKSDTEQIPVRASISSEECSERSVTKVESNIVQQNGPLETLPEQEAIEIAKFEEEFSSDIKLEIDSVESPKCSDENRSNDPPSQQSLSVKSNSLSIVRSQNNNSEKVEEIPTQSEKISSTPTEMTSYHSEEDSSKKPEKMSVLVENNASKQTENTSMEVDEDSASEAVLLENTEKPYENVANVPATTEPIRSEKDLSKQVEKMSVNSDSTSEAMSIENSTSDIEKPSEIQSLNQNSNQVEKMLVDDNSFSEVISTKDVEKTNEHCSSVVEKPIEESSLKQNERISNDAPSKMERSVNIDKLDETHTASIVESIVGKDVFVSSDSIRTLAEEKQYGESSRNNVTLQDGDLCIDRNLQEGQVADSLGEVHSPMIVDDDKEPKSVESNDIIIDSVESEIVEIDADDEPVILDEDDCSENVSASVTQTSQNKFNQLFETTAKEIAHSDIGAEVVIGDDYPIPSTSGMTNDDLQRIEISLNRLMPKDNDNRKRRLQHNQDKSSSKDPPFIEKRARISETEISDSSSDHPAGTNSTERRKKPLVNRARKHTSSTNVDKTFKEIEKKIRDGLDKKNKSQESSPSRDVFDEFDFEIHDNDGDIINDAKCDEAAQNADNNSYKIKLNYDVIGKDNLKNIFKVMRTKLTRRQLEVMMIQKCCEMISDSNEIGTLRRQVADLQQAEMFRKQKILNLEKQISQLKAVCQRYLDQVKENTKKAVTPIKITRSVGLQVARGDSSPYVNCEPASTAPKNQEKLKKLLSAPPLNNRKSVTVPESHQNITRLRADSPLPSSINARNHDSRLVNGNARINSSLSSNSSPTPSSYVSVAGSSRNNKKITKTTDIDAPVIDLTDKDDKNENEGNIAAKNLLTTVNRTVVTYVPVGQDQNRQVIKPGTSILVNGQLLTVQSTGKFPQVHPAPVPAPPPMAMVPGAKPVPPRPMLKIDKSGSGIMLSWEFPTNTLHAEVSKYQLYAYQETNVPPRSDLWKAVGDVTALPLPMACTLTQFVEGYKYHFIVRAVDIHNRHGPFSVPQTITL